MKIIVNNLTAPKTSNPFFPPEDQKEFAIFAMGLQLEEKVIVQFSIDGNTWEDLYQFGVQVGLTATNNALGAYCPTFLRVVKPLTANPVTVAISTKVSFNSVE